MENKRILIAYYSRRGNNYVAGNIVDLPVGNTEVIAQKAQALTGGDVFQIETVKVYPKDYHETTDIAQKELRANARPELNDRVSDMAAYDTIILGYPNWWGTMPMAVHTFLEQYDFSGKLILPFCTHEGSGLGHSERDIARLCPGAALHPGFAVRGSAVRSADAELKAWLTANLR